MNAHSPDLENTRMYVYRRPLHPELFSIFLDRRIDAGVYEAQLWLIGSGHLISFHAGGHTICELLTSRADLLPDTGLLESIPVDRAREYQTSYDNQLFYLLSIQVERMSEAVFDRVHEEMTKFAQRRGMYIAFDQWAAEGRRPPFAFIDYERRPTELDVFTYHAFPEQRTMLRTQSILSLEPIGAAPPLPESPFGGSSPPAV